MARGDEEISLLHLLLQEAGSCYSLSQKSRIHTLRYWEEDEGRDNSRGQRYFVHLGLCVQDCLVGEMRVRGGE